MKRSKLIAVTLLLSSLGDDTVTASTQLEDRIRQRVAAAPDNAANWRMLARVLHRRGDMRGAHDSLQQALSLDSASPAIQYDMGSLLLELGQFERAIEHLNRVVETSPDSDHGLLAAAELQQLSSDPRAMMLASFEPSWQSASPIAEETRAPAPSPRKARRLLVDVEVGGLYNSNVELAPISRQLTSSELGGFQVYTAPDLDYLLLDLEAWQGGVLFDSYFNFNESHLTNFDLQHYQPGLYLDRAIECGESELVTRAEYAYSHDLFGGQSFGDRHALTTSLSILHARPTTSLVYWTIDYTDFRDDGTTPSIDSVDGYTNTIGVARSWDLDGSIVERIDIGADGQWAELRGADHTYRGVYLYGELKTACLAGNQLVATGGWGYRDFPDFTATPSRNENFYSAGLQLDRRLTSWLRATLFFTYDSFNADNSAFAAERYTTGGFVTVLR